MTTETNPIIWFDGRDSTRQLPPECMQIVVVQVIDPITSSVGLRDLILMVL